MSAMPGADGLHQLYDAVLAPRLAALESERTKLRSAIVSGALLVGIPAVVAIYGNEFFGGLLPSSIQQWFTAISIVLLIAGVVIAAKKHAIPGFTAYLNYRTRFKREVVAEIFQAVSPGATYAPDSYIQPEIFERSGIFDTMGALRGDDLVRGRIGDTPFEACEMDRHYSTGGKNSRKVSVFHGLFFRFDFNKHVRGRTIVQPQNAASIRLGSRRGLERV